MFAHDTQKKMAFRQRPYVWLSVWLSLLAVSGNVLADDIRLVWSASPIANLGGYKVFYGLKSRSYTASIDVGKVTSYQISGLESGATYYFAVSAYDSARLMESRYSNESAIKIVPKVDFSANKTSGKASLAVNFTPAVTGTITGWRWDFGDGTFRSGTSGTVPDVIKSYEAAGVYDVSLTVASRAGSFTKAQSNLITVIDPPPPPVGTAAVNYTSNPVFGSALETGSIQQGLVAAYGFDEANGYYMHDASGRGNYGGINGSPSRIGNGRFGNALKFNGTNTWVSVSHSPSLNLTTGMTLEAWVYPSKAMSGAKTVLMKEGPFAEAYLLAANNSDNQPMSATWSGSGAVAVGGHAQIPPNEWTHLAATYDGLYQSLYVNGMLVNTALQIDPIAPSAGLLRMGGNSLWGGYFQGYIDEVRIYNRALTRSEIVHDSATAISSSNPLRFIAGNPNIEPTVASVPVGGALAFKFKCKTAERLTGIQVYVDESSTATALHAAIYGNSPANHPRSLWGSTGVLTTLRKGAWNVASIAPRDLAPDASYWMVIMGAGGVLNLRVQKEADASADVAESSASSMLTALPNTWMTGAVLTGERASVYGVGY